MGCGASVAVRPQVHNTPPTTCTVVGNNGQAGQSSSASTKAGPVSSPKKNPQVSIPAIITKEQLLHYMELEKSINAYEAQNVVQNLNTKWNQLKMITENYTKLSTELHRCKEVTNREKNEFDNLMQPSVRAFFLDESAFNAQLSKEQEEYLQALNHQEIVQKQVDSVAEQKLRAEKDVTALRNDVNELHSLYQKQDDLLALIFNNNYGSDLENLLESEHEMATDKHQRIDAAKFRWQSGRLLLYYAYQQLLAAVTKWNQVIAAPANNASIIYELATETRNNLISAMQNVNNAQRYLGNIDFPYCNPLEMKTLGIAVNNIYTDMQRSSRQIHAQHFFQVTCQRLYALLIWFDRVIETRILKDLNDAKTDLDSKRKLLRMERVRLIQEKLKKEMGIELKLELDGDGNVKNLDKLDKNAKSGQSNPDLIKRPTWTQESVATGTDSNDTPIQVPSAPPPLPKLQPVDENDREFSQEPIKNLPDAPKLDDLAPPPSQTALFGQIEDIQKRHDAEMNKYLLAQESNKARLEQGLEERLKERRSRQTTRMGNLLTESASHKEG